MSRVNPLINEAAELKPAERGELVERLLENVPVEMDDEIEEAWRDEVRERLARIRSADPTQRTPRTYAALLKFLMRQLRAL